MVFDETLNCYTTTNSLRFADAEKLTAAWWAWQEQQVEMDELQRALKLKTRHSDFYENSRKAHRALSRYRKSLIDELRKHSTMLRGAAKGWIYTEREKNILISQADDLDRILGGEKTIQSNSNETTVHTAEMHFVGFKKSERVTEQENSIKRETHKFIKNSIQETRIEQALSLIKAWDDQSYKDDAEQLINVDLVEALQGNDVIEDVRVNLSSLLDFVKSLRAEFDLNAVQGMEAVERQIELLEQFVGVDHD